MALYGATSIARVVPGEHAAADKNGDRFLKERGAMATLVRPMPWTKACAWKPAGASYGVDGGGRDWDDENSTVRSTYFLVALVCVVCVRTVVSRALRRVVICQDSTATRS